MFCTTENGIKSIARQLSPDIHIECKHWQIILFDLANGAAITEMCQYLRKIVFVHIEQEAKTHLDPNQMKSKAIITEYDSPSVIIHSHQYRN